MCKMLGVAISNASLLSDLVRQHSGLLKFPDNFEPDGFGLGYYQDERPLLSKRPRGDAPIEVFRNLANDIKSNLMILHARKATIGGWSSENTHPFRFEPWLFAHTGTLTMLQSKRKELLETLPPHLRNNLKGDTDSELLFMLILNQLGNISQISNNSVADEKVLFAIRKALSGVGYSSCNIETEAGAFFITNGNLLVAVSCGEPLHLRVQDEPPPIAEKTSDSSPSLTAPFKAVMLAVSVHKAISGFEPIPAGTVISVHRSLEIMRTKLFE